MKMANGWTLFFYLTLSVMMSATADTSVNVTTRSPDFSFRSLNVSFKSSDMSVKGLEEVDKLFGDYFQWKLKTNPQKATMMGFLGFSDQVEVIYDCYFKELKQFQILLN